MNSGAGKVREVLQNELNKRGLGDIMTAMSKGKVSAEILETALKTAASEGGFICLIKESHVVFITSNDSITILFNGHTNDRKQVSFPHLHESEVIYLNPNN